MVNYGDLLGHVRHFFSDVMTTHCLQIRSSAISHVFFYLVQRTTLLTFHRVLLVKNIPGAWPLPLVLQGARRAARRPAYFFAIQKTAFTGVLLK